jgi:hypothetical protein
VDTSRRTLLGSSLVIAGLIGLAVLVVVSVVLLGGEDAPEPEVTAPPEEPEPEPPEPEPEPPEPVEGSTELLGVRDLSVTGSRLVHSGTDADARVAIDQDAVEALIEDLAGWIDDHLTQLQDGEDGLVADAEVTGPDGLAELAGPADLVDEASYAFVIGARGEPEWAEVTVRVTLEDRSTRRARLVFDPDRRLLAVQGFE